LRWRWTYIVTVGVLFFTIPLFECYSLDGPPYYYADPVRAKVIDFETDRPVAGVVAVWWVNHDKEAGSRRFPTATLPSPFARGPQPLKRKDVSRLT
jgi:hypothetical protein